MNPDAIWLLAILIFAGAAVGMWLEFELRRQRRIERDWRERRLHRGR